MIEKLWAAKVPEITYFDFVGVLITFNFVVELTWVYIWKVLIVLILNMVLCLSHLL